jgi:hypothetical protein
MSLRVCQTRPLRAIRLPPFTKPLLVHLMLSGHATIPHCLSESSEHFFVIWAANGHARTHAEAQNVHAIELVCMPYQCSTRASRTSFGART